MAKISETCSKLRLDCVKKMGYTIDYNHSYGAYDLYNKDYKIVSCFQESGFNYCDIVQLLLEEKAGV